MYQHTHTTKQVAAFLCNLWKLTPSSYVDLISSQLEIRHYKRREQVYQYDEEPNHLNIVVEGQVMIHRDSTKQMRILALYCSGDLFGYRAHFTSGRYYSNATCITSSVIAHLPFSLVDRLMRERVGVGAYFTRQLSHLLAISDTRSEVLTQLPLRGRLIQSLLYLDGKFGTDADGHSLGIQITRAELGELSNMTTSNAIRTLSQLASEGLVKTEGKKIMLVEKEALKKEKSSYADTPK